MAEIKVTDLAEETAESLDGSESFVMFDNTSGKRGTVASIGAYILSKLTTKLGGISRTVSAAIESIESTLSAHASAISSKQDKLTFDSSPASGSKNPVTSGGIYSALIGKQNAGDYATTSALAKKQDKLTYDSTPTSGSGNPVTSDGIYSALAGKQSTGDYATHGDLSSGLAGKQDKLTFDSTPTASSTSPVTSGGVKAELDKKQDKLSIDSSPTSGSGNPVSSGGVYTALAGKQPKGSYLTQTDLDNALTAKQDVLTMDTSPKSGSGNPITSGGVYSALTGYATNTALSKKQDKLTFDTSPTASSTKPVTSGGVKTALDKKQDKLSIDGSPTSGSGNPVSSGGVASALAKKQDTIGASTALAAASLAVTGNVAGATFNGHALGDLLLVKLFKGSVTSTSTSGEIFIPYTVPDGYKTLGALYARPTNFVGGAYVAFINSGTLDCWYFSAPTKTSITVGAYLLFIRDI